MNLLAADIVERFYTSLWPMMRIGAMLMAAPLFSLDAVTVRIRVAIAMVLTFFIYPLVTWPIIDPVSAEGLLEIVNQLFIGALMGLMLQVAVGAIVVAGQSIAGSMGLSMASMMDPNVGNVATIAQFLMILSTMVFLGFGGHVILISIILDSFHTLPIGKSLLGQDSFGKVIAWSSMLFLGGLLIALPVMVSLLFINIGLGVVTRAAPSLNIFSVGFPATIVAGFLILIFSLESIIGRMQWVWMQAFSHVRDLLGVVN